MSMPFYGQKFTFTQPDGSQLEVKGWGNQNQAVFETLDGFTLVKDPTTGFYQYATVSSDGSELQPLGVIAESVNPQNFGLKKNIRVDKKAEKAQAAMSVGLPLSSKSRWEVRRERNKMTVLASSLSNGVAPAPPQRQTVGDYIGLCLLIDFPDVPATISQQEVERFCNQSGYNGYGNNGSVYDYFYDNSGGNLRYTNIVAPYYRASRTKDYYANPSVPQPHRTWELIKEALDYFKAQGFNFNSLTVDSEDYVYALNVFYAGGVVNNWAEGLWPHCYHLLTPYALAPGKLAFDYQITDIGSELTLGTFCHENGHMICDFPDLYDYGYESRGAGVYCLMCAGGNHNPKNPGQIGAYLKFKAGWTQNVTQLNTGNYQIEAGRNDFFIRKKNNTEYFIVENRQKSGRDQVLPGSGLVIWRIDELGSNNNEQMTANSHYECSVIQADGQTDLEDGVNNGDVGDLYGSGANNFSDTTTPSSKWWDGTASNLTINNISATGTTMTFTVI